MKNFVVVVVQLTDHNRLNLDKEKVHVMISFHREEIQCYPIDQRISI